MGIKPQDIGITSEDLRQKLLADLRVQIVEEKAKIKDPASADEWGKLAAFVQKVTKEWNFTPAELGLTAQDIKMVQ